jgi:hypothetical protein
MIPRTPPDREQRSRFAYRHALMLAVLMIISAACQPRTIQNEFYAHNLLTLDPSDTDTASTDMLAVYSYQSAQSLSLRIDLLDFNPSSAPSFIILLDTFPGNTLSSQQGYAFNNGWDVVLMIHPDGSSRLESIWNSTQPISSVDTSYDPVLDTVTIHLPLDVIEPPGPFELIVSSMQHPDDEPADTIGPIRSDEPPPNPIPILMAFWNSFPSTTPAQTLRSWDGAHNGPAGERFGLHHLLAAAEAYGIPVVLADLRQPSNLAGLQLLGATPWIMDLVHKGLLSLPDTLPEALCDQASTLGWPQEILTQMNDPSIRMGVEKSATLTCYPDRGQADNLLLPPGYRYLFIPEIPGYTETRLYSRETGHPRIIRFVNETCAATQSTDSGLSFDLRQQITAKFGMDSSKGVLVLSADFQNSFWGDPRSVDASMRWIAAHPWIQPISLEALARSDLVTFTSAQQLSENREPASPESPPTSSLHFDQLLPLLNNTVSDGLRRFSWAQLYHAYSLPSCQRKADSLELEWESIDKCERQHQRAKRAIELLTVAIAWDHQIKEKPAIDAFTALEAYLGRDEAIYANNNGLAILNPEGNQLEALWINHPQYGPLPIIWNPSLPNDEIQTGLAVQVEVPALAVPLKVTFNTGDNRGAFEIPLYLPTYILDPDDQGLYTEVANSYLLMSSVKNPLWQIKLEDAMWRYDSIFDTTARWDLVEDPNQEMSPGHYLPIPYGRLTINYEEPFSILFTIPDSGIEHPG